MPVTILPVNTQAPTMAQTPMGAALGAFLMGNKAMYAPQMSQQALQQARIHTNFMPGQQMASIFSKVAPGLNQAGQHVFLNPNFETMIENLMKSQLGQFMGQNLTNQQNASTVPTGQFGSMGGGQIQQSPQNPMQSPQQNGTTNFQNAQSPQNMQNTARQVAYAQAMGQSHPGVAQNNAQQAAALQKLAPLLPQLAQDAGQEGGFEGWLGTHFGSSNARNYNTERETAGKLAQEGGLGTDFLQRSWLGSSAKASVKKAEKRVSQLENQQQRVSRNATTGRLVNSPATVPNSFIAPPKNLNLSSFSLNELKKSGLTSNELKGVYTGRTQIGRDGFMYKIIGGKLYRKAQPR